MNDLVEINQYEAWLAEQKRQRRINISNILLRIGLAFMVLGIVILSNSILWAPLLAVILLSVGTIILIISLLLRRNNNSA